VPPCAWKPLQIYKGNEYQKENKNLSVKNEFKVKLLMLRYVLVKISSTIKLSVKIKLKIKNYESYLFKIE